MRSGSSSRRSGRAPLLAELRDELAITGVDSQRHLQPHVAEDFGRRQLRLQVPVHGASANCERNRTQQRQNGQSPKCAGEWIHGLVLLRVPRSGSTGRPCTITVRTGLRTAELYASRVRPRDRTDFGNGVPCTEKPRAGAVAMNVPSNIFLIGPMGAGKSTIARRLAVALDKVFVDADRELEERTGAEITLIFELEGEAGFRKREAALLAELVEREGIVLATGRRGGAVEREPCPPQATRIRDLSRGAGRPAGGSRGARSPPAADADPPIRRPRWRGSCAFAIPSIVNARTSS